MPDYIVLCLVEMEDGTAVIVTAPTGTVNEGNVVFFNRGKRGTVRQTDWVDRNTTIYTILESMVPIFPAESVWHFARLWQAPDQTNEKEN